MKNKEIKNPALPFISQQEKQQKDETAITNEELKRRVEDLERLLTIKDEPKNKQMSVLLRESEYLRLKKASRLYGESMNEIMGRALNQYLDHLEEITPPEV